MIHQKGLRASVVLGMGILVWVQATSIQAATNILYDTFEGYAGDTSSSYGGSGDFDPGTPIIGDPWVSVEGAVTLLRVINPPTVLGAFQFDPAPDGGEQYLELIRGSDSIGPEAWSPITASGQSLMSSFGQMTLRMKTFNVDGDGYVDGMRIVGYDSAVTNYANPVFDIRYQQASEGSVGTGNVQYFNGSSVVNSGLTFDENTWENLVVFVDFKAGTFNLSVDGVTSANFSLLNSAANIQSLMLAGPDTPLFGPAYNTRFFVDNILIEVPEPTTAALAGVGLLFFLQRRRSN